MLKLGLAALLEHLEEAPPPKMSGESGVGGRVSAPASVKSGGSVSAEYQPKTASEPLRAIWTIEKSTSVREVAAHKPFSLMLSLKGL